MPNISLSLSPWRKEALRTTLWVTPVGMMTLAVLLFAVTFYIDGRVYDAAGTLPSSLRIESADGARQLISALAAAVLTVLGLVVSITIVALTLASQQFGPRMVRNFIRDRGTQVSLGSFVATFVYALLTLAAIGGGDRSATFVPQISVNVTLALVYINVLVLIYFFHHITLTIQLQVLISSIAGNLSRAVDVQFPAPLTGASTTEGSASGRQVDELRAMLEMGGSAVTATKSGYLQYVSYERLVAIAERQDTVVQLLYRPGHFVTSGLSLARTVSPTAPAKLVQALARAHVTGPHRTLEQDPVFAIDQLVEIAIRALSPAVNDTFTALTCIDWLADGLCIAAARVMPDGIHRDRHGVIRVIEPGPSYPRMVAHAYDKIRQAGADTPAVAIRLLESLDRILDAAVSSDQRVVVLRQADMIWRAASKGISEAEDMLVVSERYDRLKAHRSVPPQSPDRT